MLLAGSRDGAEVGLGSLEAFQELGRQGEGLRLGAQGGQAAAAAEEDVPQGQGGAVPLPPEQQQKLHGAGGHRRGHEGA